MVRLLVDKWFNETTHYIEAAGLSTDSKPTGVITGSKFTAVDTSKEYRFDEASGQWISQN